MNARNPLPRSRAKSLAEQVMNDLVERIRSGAYQPGDKLPTEPELMAEQGVSRTVVREALSRLQAAGYAETRHGVGTFVLASEAPRSAPLDLSTVTTIRDTLAMLEIRISLESEAAGLAALRRTEDQLAAMRRALAEFEEEANRGGKSVEADFEFHLQIAKATGNHFFEEIFRHLGQSTIPRTRLDIARLTGEPDRAYLLGINREHQAILEAIARRDPQAASAGMRTHLSNSRERLRRASGIEVAP
jgi:DNA-binding FadR family transcriptional regulator